MHEIVEACDEPQEPDWHAKLAEVERRQELHVELLVALVRRVIVAEVHFPSQRLRVLTQSTGCQQVHPSHVAWNADLRIIFVFFLKVVSVK